METQLLKTALEFASNGLSVLPVKQTKQPATAGWKQLQYTIATPEQLSEYFTTSTYGIAIVCGDVSGNLECVDEDSKHDSGGTIHRQFVTKLIAEAPDLSKKLVVEKTIKGGYHYIYKITGMTIPGALKLAKNSTGEVLFETRGTGGYFVCAPTSGYELIQGSFSNIPILTPDDRALLHSIAASFNHNNSSTSLTNKVIVSEAKQSSGLSPFQSFNKFGNVEELLSSHGWTLSGQQGSKTFYKRPGDTQNTQSANWDSAFNRFYVFSTSTNLDANKSYSKTDLYKLLECNGDIKVCGEKLYDLGYGERKLMTVSADKVVFTDTELLRYDNTPRYLLFPIIPSSGTAVLAGAPDCGKSQLARQLCLSIATNQSHFLSFEIQKKHGRAIYVATEDDSVNTAYLLKQQLQGMSKDANGNLSFIFGGTLSTEEILIELENSLSKNPADIVIVDSFGDVFQYGDTNNTTNMRKCVKAFDYLAKKHDTIVMFVHHVTKAAYFSSPTQAQISGGAGLVQKVRLALTLSQGEGSTKYLSVVKGNYCPRQYKETSMVLNFDEKNFLFTNTGNVEATSSINYNPSQKDSKLERLENLAEQIFHDGLPISYKEYCERHSNITDRGLTSAKRDHKSMKELNIIVKADDGKWQLSK